MCGTKETTLEDRLSKQLKEAEKKSEMLEELLLAAMKLLKKAGDFTPTTVCAPAPRRSTRSTSGKLKDDGHQKTTPQPP